MSETHSTSDIIQRLKRKESDRKKGARYRREQRELMRKLSERSQRLDALLRMPWGRRA